LYTCVIYGLEVCAQNKTKIASLDFVINCFFVKLTTLELWQLASNYQVIYCQNELKNLKTVSMVIPRY